MFIVICGCGKVGYSLAKEMSAVKKNKVVLIEQQADICNQVAQEIPASIIINGDACEPRYLEEAQVEKADVVVAVTGDDEDNLIICQLAKTYFNVKRTIARANDPRNEYAMIQLGVDVTLNSTKIISQMINQEVSLEELSTLLKLKQGKLFIVQGKVSKKSPLTKKPIKDIKLPGNCIIVSILRKDDVIVPKGDTLIKANDELLVVTTPENEKQLNKLLVG